MYEYKIFLKEKKQIDELMEQDYQIVSVKENLNGALIQFRPADRKSPDQVKALRILTPDARKYFTNRLRLKRKVKS
ncbi:hypothetical protein OYT88_10665 [Sporolactobacillus sp. CQH2019]|uniref:hypothetical protein n=1 Tax=Sporolactobacillus sp. CQH2019 TaxID=3023512 RepID=UPI002368CBAF|nr:hypothetical protein [Sporolactobacillus sp. CQH2019]MDD9149012.1 hypothetical protein [Sporolactobacillus sp. CQH2019]